MKKLNFDNLVVLAQRDTAAAVDVADGVLAALLAMDQRQTDPYRVYLWMGVASAAVAACVLIAATVSLQNGTDSVSEMITYVSWAAQ
jgi:hypothetical protein